MCEGMGILNIGDLPSELTCRPLAIVTVLGLDIPTNPVHTAVWESFTLNRKPDRAPLNFKHIKEGYEFPKAKPKRSSYEWHVPKGLLKSNWLHKHASEVPAVAVLFYDLDWDDLLWNEKRVDCANKLENLRTNLQGRNTKIALVLVQRNPPLPGGEDMLATERAAALCSTCELAAKSLFVLPHSDHLFGYTLRLEKAFYEFSQTYYHHETRKIKTHRDHLNKTTHQLLFVRHQFKIGFLNELKQDIITALKHYKQSYANLMEVRASAANMLEVKTVAGFINYKLCRLSFLLNTPLDAISQFRKHIDIFKSKTGPAELAFEHSAWLSKQFSHFGDLFDDAVKQGLTATQTKHPGFYFQQAASHAIMRKELCFSLCENLMEYPSPDPLEGEEDMEFFGQRPWRPGSQSIEPPDPQRENKGIQALQCREAYTVNHSTIIISLLSSAISQFKKYRGPRMKRHLMVQMGEEYFYSREYSKALTLLGHVLWDYRSERWQYLVSNILTTALQCAYLSASVQDFLTLGLEFISSWIQSSTEEKCTVQNGIQKVLEGNVPPPPLLGITVDKEEIEELWHKALSVNNDPLIFTVEMGSIIPCVECKMRFVSRTFSADERVVLQIHLRAKCPQPLKFSKLSILFTNQHYNEQCEISDETSEILGETRNIGNSTSLILYPRKTKMFTFSFLASVSDVGQDITVSAVAIQLGKDTTCCAILRWPAAGDSVASSLPWSQMSSNTIGLGDESSFTQLEMQPTTKIIPRQPQLSLNVEHQPPVLMHELYCIHVRIENKEVNSVSNVRLLVDLDEEADNIVRQHTHFTRGEEKVSSLPCLDDVVADQLLPGEKVSEEVFMNVNNLGSRIILVKVTYDIEVEVDNRTLLCHCTREEKLEIDTMDPFIFSINLLNMKCESVQRLRAEEPFLLQVDVISNTSLTLSIEKGMLELCPEVKTTDENVVSNLKEVCLKTREQGTDCFCLVAPCETQKPVCLGTYTLVWRREKETGSTCTVTTTVVLPTLNIESTPLFLELKAPAHGWVRIPLTINYYLHNRTSSVQDIEAFVDSSDAFMYAGNKQLHFRIPPHDKYTLMYNLYPLVSGYVLLPRLRLVLNPGMPTALAVDDLVQEMIPSHIFIMPQGKTSPDFSVRSA
ncbi:trafficking protein particle complex subunit 11 gry isoform X1 [Tachypleus tridentatus]|uniref:trafficking protein particle complex subunit 11 gry isoform X1 n=1 Tax=Tachypleus tridentatus TaxID=6853 RepID=UPI003FD68E59